MEEDAAGSGPPEADGYEVDQPMDARRSRVHDI